MNGQQAPASKGAGSSWARSVEDAVIPKEGGFIRRTALQEAAASAVGAGPGLEPTRSRALLRGWLYRDVHLRTAGTVASFLGYEELPISTALRAANVRTSGWRVEPGRLVHPRRALSLVPRDAHRDGFVHAGDEVELPRLRCGTSPGWLTVAGLNGEVSRRCHRLYLPGVGPGTIEALVRALDALPSRIAWSLKSSIGVDRDGDEVPRADRTVVYVDASAPASSAERADLLCALAARAPVAAGPGFSVELRPGVHFGGSGNEHGSFGTRMADVAAEALVDGDLSPVERAERALANQADRFEAGEEG